MPINFLDGSRITLRESLELVNRGSRTPHPGWENTMTTLLAQLSIPIELCWEVRADLKGYRVTHFGGKRISHDDAKCGPWAEFDTDRWNQVLSKQSAKVRKLLARCETPFQAHMVIAKNAFPYVETSASFYLRHREIVQQVLEVIARSRFREHFAKFVDESGNMHQIYQAYGNSVYYQGNHTVAEAELADAYVRLLEFVEQSEAPGARVAFPAWGVLPDARILCLLDMVIYALTANTDSVYAWSGTSMMQYILKEADSQRWREIVSGMYDLVRKHALPQLPEVLTFTLIPTLGLGNLAISDAEKAAAVNGLLRQLNLGNAQHASADRDRLQDLARTNAPEFLREIRGKLSQQDLAHVMEMVEKGNWKGAGGKASALMKERVSTPSEKDVYSEVGRLLTTEEGSLLTCQEQVDALAYLTGTRLYVLEGVLDLPMGKLESYRAKLEQYAQKAQKGKDQRQSDRPYFSRIGWY